MADFDPAYADGNDTAIKGATDGTHIGNVADALKVFLANSSVVISEDSNATFSAYAQGIAIGNNKSMFSLVNASGSTVKIKIHDIKIINVQTTAVTGVIADFRLQRCVGHSAGTSITPDSFDTTNTLNGSVTARTNATITTESAAIIRRALFSTDEWGVGAIDVESYHYPFQLYDSFFKKTDNTKALVLNANEGFTIKQVTNSTVGTFDILVLFTQE